MARTHHNREQPSEAIFRLTARLLDSWYAKEGEAAGSSERRLRNAMISPGDRAPEFTGTLAGGQKLHLRDFLGRRHVILYFFPKDFTPG